MLLRKYEMPWRTTYEAYATTGWFLAILTLGIFVIANHVPRLPLYFIGVLCLVFLISSSGKTWKIFRLKLALAGKDISFIDDEKLEKKIEARPGAMWLGTGYNWTPIHTQRLYEIKKADPDKIYPPKIVMKGYQAWTGQSIAALNPDYVGAPWIHGLEPKEEDLYGAIQNFEGNTLVLGTTRCGKTRLLELVTEMAIMLGYMVIVVDPKGDQPFEKSIKAACKKAGRERDFVRFHLAFPREGVRIDLLKNYTNPSDLATRISSLMPGGDKSSSFRDFAWSVLNSIILGMLFVGEKPTLVTIRGYVDNGVADLLLRVILKYFDEILQPGWEYEIQQYAKTLKTAKGKPNDDGEVMVRQSLNLLLSYYMNVLVGRGFREEAIQSLSTIYRHDSAHYGKMIANLVPILGMLTTGELGPLLSPDPSDVTDTRPITDNQALIRSDAVVYIGLDSLANKAISTAVGSMYLSDMTSCAASIYNNEPGRAQIKKIFMLVDEASEVVNDPYTQMLNKSAGAGFIHWTAAQTVPDFAARFESMDKARQLLGNYNNLFALRSKDGVTQEFIVETFGETYVNSKQVTYGSTSKTETNITHFTGSVQERLLESLEEIFPAADLGQLPNWQYMASISGGRLIKGRLPIIQHV